jgi:two-component system, response regulator RegA
MTGEPRRARRLLIVEDDDVLRGRLARAFRERGFEVRETADAAVAARQARGEPPSHALVDLRLPDASGLAVVRALIAADRAMAVVVLTGYGSIATALEAVRLGARHYLTKPADADEILSAFERDPSGSPSRPSPVPSLARVEWEHINRVLADCGGNISEAARVLGIHRRSLQRKLAKFPAAR